MFIPRIGEIVHTAADIATVVSALYAVGHALTHRDHKKSTPLHKHGHREHPSRHVPAHAHKAHATFEAAYA
jgi:hypothetical protein